MPRLFASDGASDGSFTRTDFYVDDIEAAVADLRARGVVFEQYDGAVNGIMDITPRSGHLTSDHKGYTHMPMWYRVLSAGYTLSVSMAM